MGYLERSRKIVGESQQNLDIQLNGLTIAHMGTGFARAGAFYSPEMGRVIPVGFKFPTGYSARYSYRHRFQAERAAQELFLIDLIDREVPSVAHMLPTFRGVVMDSTNNVLAIMTEDFSAGGKLKVEDHKTIPDELDDFFAQNYPRFSAYGSVSILEHMAFKAGGQIKLDDFDSIVYFENADRRAITEIRNNLESYAIRTDRDIIQEYLDSDPL